MMFSPVHVRNAIRKEQISHFLGNIKFILAIGDIMKQYSTQFSRLLVGETFSKNGNIWRKQSTRTAKIVIPEEYSNKTFYFSKDEQIIIAEEQLKFIA